MSDSHQAALLFPSDPLSIDLGYVKKWVVFGDVLEDKDVPSEKFLPPSESSLSIQNVFWQIALGLGHTPLLAQ